MHDSWLELVDGMLRPARPRLEHCLREGEAHRVARQRISDERARALLDCQRHIEQARAAVFAADDGVVPSRMTELERHFRSLLRSDPDHGLMDLWARIAPGSWIDRKRWRDSAEGARLDAAIALASDVDGVEAAEAAVSALRVALASWGITLCPVVHWQSLVVDADCVTQLLQVPARAALDALSDRSVRLRERATQLELTVHAAAKSRFPDRPQLTRAIAYAAHVDLLLHAAARSIDRPNPVTALRELWGTGYALAAIDSSKLTLEIPTLT